MLDCRHNLSHSKNKNIKVCNHLITAVDSVCNLDVFMHKHLLKVLFSHNQISPLSNLDHFGETQSLLFIREHINYWYKPQYSLALITMVQTDFFTLCTYNRIKETTQMALNWTKNQSVQSISCPSA